MPKNSCIMQIWAEPAKSALPICEQLQIGGVDFSVPLLYDIMSVATVALAQAVIMRIDRVVI